MESINALREDVANLRSELGEIKRSGASVSSHRAPGKLCTLYVRVPEGGSEVSHIGKARLESLLDCEVPQYVCIKQLPPSFKVKILESCLQSAVDSGRRHGCFVDRWCAQASVRRFERSDFTAPDRKISQSGIQLSCWNCRGLSTSLPYLKSLLEEGSKIVVLSEHWLCPYELHKLSEIDEEYEAIGKSDSRLTEEREGRRGCGGDRHFVAPKHCCYSNFWYQLRSYGWDQVFSG